MDSNLEITGKELVSKLGNDHSPTYWKNAFAGTPSAIFVPPYIRFLQGQVALHKALNFLVVSRDIAKSGFTPLSELLESIDNSPDSKQAETSFETLFAAALFVNLIADVEQFFVSCAATAIRLHPGKVGNEAFRLTEILTTSHVDELIERAADKKLQALMYEKPSDYLSGLCEIVSIDKRELLHLWPEFIEMKARRDLGVHNNWTVNSIYLRKLKEANLPDMLSIGSRITPDFAYLNAASVACGSLVGRMANLMADKWLPIPEASSS